MSDDRSSPEGALVVIDHDQGELASTAAQAIALARTLGDGPVVGLVIGAGGDTAVVALAGLGLDRVIHAVHPGLVDYAPEAWGDVVAALAVSFGFVVATGSERGNEVLAHAAAVLDVPFAANVLGLQPGVGPADPVTLRRVRWGGSLVEHATLQTSGPVVLSGALHAFGAEPDPGAAPPPVTTVEAALDDATVARTRVAERVSVAAGITLQTAPVVVSGGRGVGGAVGFEPLEALAALLGGAVGCSRVVTNQGWRPHADQVGQTGKRVAPDLYIACGISGAIQHWIGMQAAKHVLAINTDADAPMVTKADSAVIGDLAEVVPAIVAEVQRRRG